MFVVFLVATSKSTFVHVLHTWIKSLACEKHTTIKDDGRSALIIYRLCLCWSFVVFLQCLWLTDRNLFTLHGHFHVFVNLIRVVILLCEKEVADPYKMVYAWRCSCFNLSADLDWPHGRAAAAKTTPPMMDRLGSVLIRPSTADSRAITKVTKKNLRCKKMHVESII